MHKLSEYLPSYLLEIYDFSELLKTEQEEIDLLTEQIYRALDNNFVDTADDYGIKRFEKMYNIKSQNSQSLEERRFIVKSLMTANVPINMNFLREYLSKICGQSGYTIMVESDIFKVTINLTLPSRNVEKVLRDFLRKIIPCNMSLEVNADYSESETRRLGGLNG